MRSKFAARSRPRSILRVSLDSPVFVPHRSQSRREDSERAAKFATFRIAAGSTRRKPMVAFNTPKANPLKRCNFSTRCAIPASSSFCSSCESRARARNAFADASSRSVAEPSRFNSRSRTTRETIFQDISFGYIKDASVTGLPGLRHNPPSLDGRLRPAILRLHWHEVDPATEERKAGALQGRAQPKPAQG